MLGVKNELTLLLCLILLGVLKSVHLISSRGAKVWQRASYSALLKNKYSTVF